MKADNKMVQLVVAMILVIFTHGLAVAQPTNVLASPSIDAATGLPLATANAFTSNGGLRPQTPQEIEAVFNPSPTNPPSIQEENLTRLQQAQALCAGGRHDQALQKLQALYAQIQAETNSGFHLKEALPVWVELGRKYSPARQALADIQYEDTRAFARDQGSVELFQELYDINAALGTTDATFSLYKNLRQSHPQLAADCFYIMEPALLARGEYQMSLDRLGNPETQFAIYCNTFRQLNGFNLGTAEMQRETSRKNDEFLRQLGGPPPPTYPRINGGKHLARLGTNLFVNEVREEIEILVGTGHQELADKIRDDAIVIADDPRLQSAVTDAVTSVRTKLPPARDVVPQPAGNETVNH